MHNYADLMRMSVAAPGDDFRLEPHPNLTLTPTPTLALALTLALSLASLRLASPLNNLHAHPPPQPGNDFRLGAMEAPPAIISTYLGESLTSFLEQVKHTRTNSPRLTHQLTNSRLTYRLA